MYSKAFKDVNRHSSALWRRKSIRPDQYSARTIE